MLVKTVNRIEIHKGNWTRNGPAPRGGTPTHPFYCKAPGGVVLDEFKTRGEAVDFAKWTTDYVARGGGGAATGTHGWPRVSRSMMSGGGAKATGERPPSPRPPTIPKIITHRNLDPLLDAVNREPYFMIEWSRAKLPRPRWVDTPVYLEMPTGEIARDGLTTLALVGFAKPESLALTGKEGFNAQGLEGKVRVKKPLFNALMNMRDILAPGRGRIVLA